MDINKLFELGCCKDLHAMYNITFKIDNKNRRDILNAVCVQELACEKSEHHRIIRDRLLEYAGIAVDFIAKDLSWVDLDKIFSGIFWDTGSLAIVVGEDSILEYVDGYKENSMIHMIGFALNSSGIWKEHQWAIELTKDRAIINELWLEQLAYFGYPVIIQS